MKISIKISLAASAAFAVLSAPALAATSLISNGSFETAPAGNSILPGNDNTIPGWTTVNEGVEWFTSGTSGTGPAHDGISMIDLAWFTSNGTPGGGIQQSFATTPGQTYVLTFYGINTNSFGRTGGGVVETLIDGNALASVNVVRFQTSWASTSDWQPYTQSFVAAATTTTLTFKNTQNALEHFAYIDSVSVVAAVPEPETYALMLAGIGLVHYAARRRKRS